MTFEISCLLLAHLLQVGQFFIMALAVNLQVGIDTTTGPRDTPMTVTGIAGRLKRAFQNHFESLLSFSVGVIALALTGAASTWLTQALCVAYLVGRVLFIPAYAFAWQYWRSAFWGIAFFSAAGLIVIVLGQVLAG